MQQEQQQHFIRAWTCLNAVVRIMKPTMRIGNVALCPRVVHRGLWTRPLT